MKKKIYLQHFNQTLRVFELDWPDSMDVLYVVTVFLLIFILFYLFYLFFCFGNVHVIGEKKWRRRKKNNKNRICTISVIQNCMFDWWFCDSFCSFSLFVDSPQLRVKQTDNDTKVKQLINTPMEQSDNIHWTETERKGREEKKTHTEQAVYGSENVKCERFIWFVPCTQNEIDHLSTPSTIICLALWRYCWLVCDKISVLIFRCTSSLVWLRYHSTYFKSYESL